MNEDPLYRCAAALNLRVRSETDVRVRLPNGPFTRGDQMTLAVLEAFASARSVDSVIPKLRKRFPSDEEQTALRHQITELCESGILKSASVPQSLASGDERFDAPSIHIRMLNDRVRTLAYQQAIRELVTPDDVIVDVGTGTGILAATAALCGAKHVYAIEQTSMAGLATEVFAANGISDRVTVIRGRSTDIELPEPASVLVSEIIGNDPLQEGILPVTADAVARHLTPTAALIPGRIELFALPVSIPNARFNKYVFSPALASVWQDWYGIDFSPLVDASERQNHQTNINSFDVKEWTALSKPIKLASIHLRESQAGKKVVNSRQSFRVRALDAGQVSGVLVYFEAQLSPNVTLSTHPTNTMSDNHWGSHLWIAGRPIDVKFEDEFELTYQFKRGSSELEVSK